MPELRCIGLEPYPSRFVPAGSARGFNNRRNTRLSAPTLTVDSGDSKTVNVVLKPVWEGNEGNEFVQSWSFDVERLVPTRFERKVLALEGGKKVARPLELQVIDWEMKKGLYLPVRVIGDKVAQKNDITYSIETTAFFNWISVNEPFRIEMFDKKLVDSETALTRLVEPSLNDIKARIER